MCSYVGDNELKDCTNIPTHSSIFTCGCLTPVNSSTAKPSGQGKFFSHTGDISLLEADSNTESDTQIKAEWAFWAALFQHVQKNTSSKKKKNKIHSSRT